MLKSIFSAALTKRAITLSEILTMWFQLVCWSVSRGQSRRLYFSTTLPLYKDTF